jgi:hypothetical protein
LRRRYDSLVAALDTLRSATHKGAHKEVGT